MHSKLQEDTQGGQLLGIHDQSTHRPSPLLAPWLLGLAHVHAPTLLGDLGDSFMFPVILIIL